MSNDLIWLVVLAGVLPFSILFFIFFQNWTHGKANAQMRGAKDAYERCQGKSLPQLQFILDEARRGGAISDDDYDWAFQRVVRELIRRYRRNVYPIAEGAWQDYVP